MLKSLIFITGLCLLLPMLGSTQSASISDVLSVQLRDSGPLEEDGVVTGYYFIYGVDDSKKGFASMVLQLHDANLNLLKKKTISVPDDLTLDRVMCNGSSVSLKFVNFKEEMYVFKTYSLEGESLYSSNSAKFSNLEKAKFSAGSEQTPSFYPIKGAGYVNYTMERPKGEKHGYKLSFYSDAGTTAHWAHDSDSEKIEFAIHLTGDANRIYAIVAKRDALLSMEADLFVTAFDTKTGKVIYQVPLKSKEYNYLTFSAFALPDDQLQLIGRYYDKDANVFKDKELGFAMVMLDGKGATANATHVAATDAKLKSLQSKSDDSEMKGYFFFHDFITLGDGRILGIAELYSMKVNVLGLMTGGAGGTVVMEDMCLFEFNDKFELQNVKRFDKYKSSFPIPGIPILSPILYAYFVKEHGGFDYVFYQKKPDEAFAAVSFLNYERRKGEKNNTVLGSIFVTDAGYTTDKFDLSTEADFNKVMPGPFGSVVVMEYYRKEKSLKVVTKNLNY